MAVLTKAQRAKAPKLLPSKGMFPVPDKEHAEKAAQLAPRAEKTGSITPREEREVIAKAHRMLGLKHKTKPGKMWR